MVIKTKQINNIKKIREIYGITQEQIAEAINVNRVTVANWESNASRASSGNLEKLSIFFGVGPEFFYEKELNDNITNILLKNAQRANEIESHSEGKRCKTNEFNSLFSKTSFLQALKKYVFSMKMLLATAEDGTLDDLTTAVLVNKKLGERLESIINLKREEEKAKSEKKEDTLRDLIDKLSNSN